MRSSNRAPRANRLCERPLVQIVKLTPDGQSMRQLTETYGEPFKSLGQIMRGRLPFERCVRGEHDFFDPALRHAGNELVDRKVLGANPLECRKPAAKHVIPAGKQARTVKRPEVCDLLDDAQGFVVTPGIATDAAGVARIDIAANRTCRELVRDILEGGKERLERGFATLDEMQNGTSRRTGPEPRQP